MGIISDWKLNRQLTVWHRVVALYMFVLIVWGLYRLLFRFPVWFEEVVLKGLVFGLPVFWLALKKDKWSLKDLGFNGDNLFQSVYLGLFAGMVLGLVGSMGNIIRHAGLSFSSFGMNSNEFGGFLLLALVTAFWEELLFAGYFLKKLENVISDEWTRVIVVAVMYVVLHGPALIFIQQVKLVPGLINATLLLSVGIANGIVMLRSKNLAAPILMHALWGTTIYLFR